MSRGGTSKPARTIDVEAVWAKLSKHGVTREAVAAATASAYSTEKSGAGMTAIASRLRSGGIAGYQRAESALADLGELLDDDELSRQRRPDAWATAVELARELSELVTDFRRSYEHVGVDLSDSAKRFPDGQHGYEVTTQIQLVRLLSAWLTPWEIAQLLVAGFEDDDGKPIPALPAYGPAEDETLVAAVRRVENIVLPQLRRDTRKAHSRSSS